MNAPRSLPGSQQVKLTIDDYLLLYQAGALSAYPKTELLDGVILAVSPQYMPHGYPKAEIAYRLRRALEALGSPLYVSTEGSVAMPLHSMPEPDITVSSVYRDEGAIPVRSVALAVEICVTTRDIDLGKKVRVYAASGVPEYWVLDVEDRCLHQMWAPGVDGYAERREVALGERVEAMTIGGLRVDTSDI